MGQAQFRHSREQLAQMALVMFLVCLQPLHHFWGALDGGLSLNLPSKRPLHHWQVQLSPCVVHAGALGVARSAGVGFAGALLMLGPLPALGGWPVLLQFIAESASTRGLHHRSKVVGAWVHLIPFDSVASSLPSALWGKAR